GRGQPAGVSRAEAGGRWGIPRRAGPTATNRIDASTENAARGPSRSRDGGIAALRLDRSKHPNCNISMKLTLQTKLLPDPDQADRLRATVERSNEAADWLAG